MKKLLICLAVLAPIVTQAKELTCQGVVERAEQYTNVGKCVFDTHGKEVLRLFRTCREGAQCEVRTMASPISPGGASVFVDRLLSARKM